jgi:hypothetical protein
MGQCKQCNDFLPPGFIENERCVFCVQDRKIIHYGEGKSVTKDEIIKEYDIFLKMVKEKNEILKNAVRGDASDVPESLLTDDD